jgi:hypothetical protein
MESNKKSSMMEALKNIRSMLTPSKDTLAVEAEDAEGKTDSAEVPKLEKSLSDTPVEIEIEESAEIRPSTSTDTEEEESASTAPDSVSSDKLGGSMETPMTLEKALGMKKQRLEATKGDTSDSQVRDLDVVIQHLMRKAGK